MTIDIMVKYALVGLIAGVLAGLLGVGGGIVIVPMLVFCFVRQGVQPEVMMHLALGTSLASIMFTFISSCLAHHRRGAVLWKIVRRITPGILLGTFLGTFVASRLSTGFLRVFFCVFLYVIATQMLLNKKPKPSRELPGTGGMFEVGGVIAVAGALGYVVNNLHTAGLPEWSLGGVYLPALLFIVCGSVLTAPFGARLAHALPVDKLKRIFAVFLYIVATRMVWGMLA